MLVRITDEARSEFREAREYYDGQRAGLGRELAGEIVALLHTIRDQPRRFPLVSGDIRRAYDRRFSLGIFYRIRSVAAQEEVLVLSISHLARDPKRWQSR